jgi:putative ABC transport system permease protein
MWIRNAWRNWRGRRHADAELDEEVRSYADMLADEKMRSSEGMPAHVAQREANMELGGIEQVKERIREVRAGHFLETLCQDVRYGVRMLRKSPGFTAVAVLTLALGIGANTAIFTLVDSILLKPLSFPNSSSLVRLYQANPKSGSWRLMNSLADLEDAQKQNDVFEEIAPYRQIPATLTGRGVPEILAGASVSRRFFRVLEIQPLLGYVFDPEERTGGSNQTVLLSQALWERHFDGSPKAIGKTAVLNGKPYTIIGVMPAGFHFPPVQSPAAAMYRTEFWIPLPQSLEPRGNRDIAAIARLKAGVSIAEAQARLNTIAARLARAYAMDKGWLFQIVPLQETIVGNTRLPILLLFGAVAFVLLIACANVANLLLARTSTRRKEMAIRAALGANRSRIVQQLLCESTLVALGGGLLGVVLAAWATTVLRSILPADTPRITEIGISGAVLAFTFALSVTVGVLFGLAPAISVSKPLPEALQRYGSSSFGLASFRPRALNAVVVFQVALSVALLVGGGLMARSYLRLTSVHLGFRPERLLTFVLQPSGESYKTPRDSEPFFEQVLARIAVMPGAESVALVNDIPFTGYSSADVTIEGRIVPHAVPAPQAFPKSVSASYFRTMEIPLIAGRFFTTADTGDSPSVVIVNQAFQRRYFSGTDPLGKRIGFAGAKSHWCQIVGVVGDTRDVDLKTPPSPELYAPFLQMQGAGWAVFMVRTKGNPRAMTDAVRHAVFAVDRDQPLALVQSMEQILSSRTAPTRFRSELLGTFSLLALVLTAVGLYGILAYSVARRTHEIGVRAALGAQPGNVLRMVICEGMVLVGMGIVFGMAGALALTRLLTSMLFEVKPTDPATFAGVAILLPLVALFACYIPARRAMKVDPIVALRYE